MTIIVDMLKTKAKTAIFLSLLIFLSLALPQQNTYADADNDNEIILTFGGDVTFGYKNEGNGKGSQPYFLEMFDMDYSMMFSNIYDIFSNDDLTMVNLETTITEATKHVDQEWYFRAPYDYVNILTEGSVEAVSIANNHAKDYLAQGRTDTVRTLMENDILVAGEEYVSSVEIKGIKIALLAYVTFRTGFNYETAIARDIPYLEKTHDIVIVSMHFAKELEYQPSSSDVRLAHKMIDLGADLVVGHGPHVVRGIENYNGKYIVYSLGNCSFAGSSSPTDHDIILFQQKFKLTENGVEAAEARVIPCSVASYAYPDLADEAYKRNDYMPTPYEGDSLTRVLNKVLTYSENLDYGLKELSADWILDPYTWEEYKLEKKAEEEKS